MWEFTKILTYQNRFFSRNQIEAISMNSNLPMYWPSRAYDASTNGAASTWEYNAGGAGCQDSGSCEFPRTFDNVRLQPVPSGEQRVVLIVMGCAADTGRAFNPLRFHSRSA